MSIVNSLKELVTQYHFTVDSQQIHCDPIGIGDLLILFAGLQQGLITPPIIINLHMLVKYHPNPRNSLEFRLALLQDIVKYAKNLTLKDFVFSDASKWTISTRLQGSYLKLSRLISIDPQFFNIEQPLPYKEYIIFHTKCRVDQNFNYLQFLSEAKHFCTHFKSRYPIILLGEQQFPKTFESDILKTRTLYDELLHLRKHNTVIDMTKNEIYNSLDYTNFKNDSKLIRHAVYNVCVGFGGHYCTSLAFGTKVIHYCPLQSPFNQQVYAECAYFKTSPEFFAHLGGTLGSPISPSSTH